MKQSKNCSTRSYTNLKEEERRCEEDIRAQGREQNTHRPGVIPFPVPVSCPPHLSTECKACRTEVQCRG